MRSEVVSAHVPVRPVVAFVCLGLLAGPHSSHAQSSAPPGYTPGVRLSGMVGIRQTSREIMARGATIAAQKAASEIRVLPHPNVQDLRPNPASPNTPIWPASSSGSSPSPKTPQTLGVNFEGANLYDTRSFPPDSMGCIGPSQFVVACNGRIRSFNKVTGQRDGAIDTDTDVFFTSVMTPPTSNNFTSDPRIRYDRLSGRWFITMIDVPGQTGTSPNRVLLAVSDSGNITLNTVWTFFEFAATSANFGDYPTLGVDGNALYIAVSIFGSRGLRSSLTDTHAFVVQKSSVLGAGPIVVTAFSGLLSKSHGVLAGPFTLQGADNFDPSSTEGYMIAVDSAFYGQLHLFRVSDPGGTPSLSSDIGITIPLNGATISVPHLGNTNSTTGYLDSGDYRLLMAHFRNGHLWTSENIGVDNTGASSASGATITRMGVRWYDFTGIATGQTPTLNQSGTLYQPSASNTTDQRCYWMGSIMVSGQGHAALGFSVAGANEYANAGTVGRLANDPLGTLRTPVLYTASSTAYNPPGDPGSSRGRRWGDYSYTSLDPSDDMTMWTIQEYCDATNIYGVQVVRLLAPPPATPSTCTPSTLTNGASGINISVTGSSNGDTGFFDPGAGFANHISAAFSGAGITVNNVTYTDPTHLTLNVSVASGALGGTRTLTVTNPDGQSAVSSSTLVTVLGPANSAPVLTSISDRTINELTQLSFTNSATDSDGDTLAFSLDAGYPTGASINPITGVFSWTPTEAQGPGTYHITVRVADNGSPSMSATQTFTVNVNEVNSAPVLASISDRTIHAGSTLVITNSATDSDIPTNTLTFSLQPGAPSNASIGPSTGVFTWTPDDSFANTTNSITVQVTDNGSPPLSDSKSFNVTVVSRPMISAISRSNDVVTLSWSSIAGQTYRAQFKDNLSALSWSDLSPDVTATGSIASTTDPTASIATRFYRIRLVP